MHKAIEQYSLNAWPALQTLVHDGWLLRFADGYTKRSNSISAIYAENDEHTAKKVQLCESLYASAGLDVVFKMTPFVPSSLDPFLAKHDYAVVDPSSVKVLNSLEEAAASSVNELEVCEYLSQKWLDTSAEFLNMTERNTNITKRLLSDSLLKKGYFILYDQSVPVASGLGVIEGGYVGLYDIVTAEAYRNRGYGEQLVRGILDWARLAGATKSYLLVVQTNKSALKLYEKLGYEEIYTYWYRVKRASAVSK